MSHFDLSGSQCYLPTPDPLPTQSFSQTANMNATGTKTAFIGRVWNKDRATKSVRFVGFRFAAVTKAGGSGLTVSLQDVDAANGPVYRPDESQDQTVAIANGDGSFVSNTWITTGNLSADRSVAYGEWLAVVVEFNGSGRLGSDAFRFHTLIPYANAASGHVGIATKNSGVWAFAASAPNCVLGFSDGTFGTFMESIVASNVGTLALNTGTTPDEVALKITSPATCYVDGAVMSVVMASSAADFDMVLYNDSGSALATASVDANITSGSTVGRYFAPFSSEVLIRKGQTYYLTLKPTTANSVSFAYTDVATAAHFQALPGGNNYIWSQRTDAGSWSDTTTRRPAAALRISKIMNPARASLQIGI